MRLKPALVKKETTFKKKPLNLSFKVTRSETLLSEIITPDECYTGNYRNSFPWKPVMKFSEIITNEDKLKKLQKAMLSIPEFAFDTETNTLEVHGPTKKQVIVGISISWGEENNYYIPVGHLREEDIDNQLDIQTVVKYLRKPFRRTDVRIIGHNLKFDLHVIKRAGISIRTKDLFCTMLASWLCDENTANGLKENSDEKMGVDQTHFKEVTNSVPNTVKKSFGYASNAKVPFSLVLIKDGAPYAIADAFYTYMLYLGFVPLLEEVAMDKIYYKHYIPFMLTLFEMEEKGVTVDTDKLKIMQSEMAKDLDELQYKIYEISGVEFNINSPQQKAELLYGWEKPDTPVIKKEVNGPPKIPKALQKILDKYKGLNIRSSKDPRFKDLNADLEKAGYYADEQGKIWKKANRNQKLLDMSFNFKCRSFTDTGNPSCDADAIWKLSQQTFKLNKRKQQGVEMCKYLAKYAKLSKLKTAFADGLLEQIYDDGKVHPSFNQIGTDSGRISCSSPNLQQLPKAKDDDKYQIRSVFIGSIDEKTNKRMNIIALDYHNLEMVCLTYYSKDKNLTEMFANDDDAHGSTAVNMFGLDCTSTDAKKLYPHLRQAAKTINFMLMYGGGARRLYEALRDDQDSPLDLGSKEYLKAYGCKNGIEVAQVFIDKYFESYAGVAKFITGQKKYAKKHKFVYTIMGRKRRLPDINSSDREVASYNERLAVNSSIQGTAGDITSSAQILVNANERLKELRCNMLIQVHDELVFECPEENTEEAIKIIKDIMEHPFGYKKERIVPFLRADFDFGKSYQEAK